MTRIAVVTDSCADLDHGAAVRSGLTIVPVTISLEAAAILNQPVTPYEGAARDSGETASDESPRELVDMFAAVFADLGKTHDSVIAVLMSGRLGKCVAAATAAGARSTGAVSVSVIDSRSVSLGLGFQALHAAELARRGVGPDEIVAELLAARDRYHVAFSIESVEHLRRSGQIGRSAALIAEALQLKPLLRLDEGQIVPYQRARTRAGAIAELVEFVKELPNIERCAVLHAANRDDADRLTRRLAQDTGLAPDRLFVRPVGDALAAQVGSGALGVAVEEADVA